MAEKSLKKKNRLTEKPNLKNCLGIKNISHIKFSN